MSRSLRSLANKGQLEEFFYIGQDVETKQSSFSSEMEVAKPSAPPDLEVRFDSSYTSAIKKWLSSELEEMVFSLTRELFMTKHYRNL